MNERNEEPMDRLCKKWKDECIVYHLDKNPFTSGLEDFELMLCVCGCTVINIEFESPFVHVSLRNYFKP